MNDPMQLIMSVMRSGGNPMQILQQMAVNNPQAAQAARMIGGKSPTELKQIALNMCQERGITPESVLKQLGIR